MTGTPLSSFLPSKGGPGGISPAAIGGLQAEGFRFMEEVVMLSDAELLSVKGVASTSVARIRGRAYEFLAICTEAHSASVSAWRRRKARAALPVDTPHVAEQLIYQLAGNQGVVGPAQVDAAWNAARHHEKRAMEYLAESGRKEES